MSWNIKEIIETTWTVQQWKYIAHCFDFLCSMICHHHHHHHHHHVQEGLGLIPVPCILKMKLVPPSLPRSSCVSSSFWFISVICQLYKLTLSDQVQVTLQRRVWSAMAEGPPNPLSAAPEKTQWNIRGTQHTEHSSRYQLSSWHVTLSNRIKSTLIADVNV